MLLRDKRKLVLNYWNMCKASLSKHKIKKDRRENVKVHLFRTGQMWCIFYLMCVWLSIKPEENLLWCNSHRYHQLRNKEHLYSDVRCTMSWSCYVVLFVCLVYAKVILFHPDMCLISAHPCLHVPHLCPVSSTPLSMFLRQSVFSSWYFTDIFLRVFHEFQAGITI